MHALEPRAPTAPCAGSTSTATATATATSSTSGATPRPGLDNQCWKDSLGLRSSSPTASSRRCRGPTVRAAGLRLRRQGAGAARLAREVWDDPELADRLEQEAGRAEGAVQPRLLARRTGAGYALALDGDKNPVDSLTSNIGHLLWTGIVDDERVAAASRRS